MNIKVNHFKRPGAKFHRASLLVKRKVSDINRTRASKRGWAVPGTGPIVVNDNTSLVLFKSTAELTVCTVERNIAISKLNPICIIGIVQELIPICFHRRTSYFKVQKSKVTS